MLLQTKDSTDPKWLQAQLKRFYPAAWAELKYAVWAFTTGIQRKIPVPEITSATPSEARSLRIFDGIMGNTLNIDPTKNLDGFLPAEDTWPVT